MGVAPDRKNRWINEENKIMNRHLRRLVISMCASFGLNFAVAANSRVVSSFDELSTFDRTIDSILEPAVMIVNWFMGEGSDLSRIWIYFGVSFIFYTILFWVLFSLWDRMCSARKHGKQTRDSSPAL